MLIRFPETDSSSSCRLTSECAVQYMIQCKFKEASERCGRLVDTHNVILVR